MAIFHSHLNVVSRSTGRSSVAAAAYRSGTRLTNERDGVTHDYSHRHDVVHSEIVLPDGAPSRWLDRSTLWNEVERSERSSRAQLAREIEYALPRELDRGAQVELARAYAQSFADEGMAVDFSIHDRGDGNPHVHQLMTLRPCDGDGFLPKSVNEYLMRDAEGNERHATAAEAKSLGGTWEKVYRYRNGAGELTMTEAEARGLDPRKGRSSRSPVQRTRYLVDWNEKGKAEMWRARLAETVNRALAASGSDRAVDHRSYGDRGLDRMPTRHEGFAVRRAEAKARERAREEGVPYVPVTDRRRENDAVRRLNEWFDSAIRRIRAAMEGLRRRMAQRSSAATRKRRRRTRSRNLSMNKGMGPRG